MKIPTTLVIGYLFSFMIIVSSEELNQMEPLLSLGYILQLNYVCNI